MFEKLTDYVYPPARFAPRRPRSGVLREAYDAVLDGLLEYRENIRMPGGVGTDDLKDMFNLVKSDYPELFYVRSAKIVRAGLSERSLTLRPDYLLDERLTLAVLEAMVRETDEVVRSVRGSRSAVSSGTFGHGDCVDDLAVLHDWLAQRFSYEDDGFPYAHEAAGPLVYGLGVCDGVSRAMKFLCDRCGIACCVVSGEAYPSADRSCELEPHSWNLVRTDSGGGNAWSNVDVTFDAGISHGIVRHDYFCRSDVEISGSHRRDEPSVLPAGTSSRSYYQRHGLAARSARELGKIIDRWLPSRGAVEFTMPNCWRTSDQIADAVEQGVARSTAFGAFPRAYVLYPNYDLMVFGLEKAS